MKKLLLGSSALLGAAVAAAPAMAADPIKLSVGGFFKTTYMVVIDDNDEFDLGFDHNTDGFFSDSEIHFTGSTVLDNGLEVGARVELEGETDSDQIDEAWIFFSGGFGEVRIGSDDEALANACIVPPGGTGNFSAFSPNQWGANSAGIGGNTFFGPSVFSSNSVCTGVDGFGDAQKIIYISPSFAGFQLTGSYTPNEASENHTFFGGPHLGMAPHVPLLSRHNFSVYGTYQYEGEGWGLTAGLGGSWEGHVEESGLIGSVEEQDFYQAGLNLSFGNFSIGAVGEYFNDVLGFDFDDNGLSIKADIWVAGVGAAYQMDAWTFGLQYSHRETEIEASGATSIEIGTQQDRVVGTVVYALGPGITIDGELGYTWVDMDPEFESLVPDAPAGIDDYDAIEIGIGTNFTF